MRAEGALRLVLNVRLFPSMKIEAVGDKAARFIAPTSEKNELGTYLVRVILIFIFTTKAAKPETIKELISVVDAHKNVKTVDSKESKGTQWLSFF